MRKSLTIAALLCCCAAAAQADEVSSTDTAKDIPLKECISETSGFRMHGRFPAYVVDLENRCEKRLRCKVNLYVTTAFGVAQGQTTLTLAPHAAGDAARKSYALKVKALGGMAQGSRACEPL